jgi:outer membrane protein
LVNAGSLPKGNLFEIQAQEATEELQLVNAENQLEISYLDMIQLLELDSVGDFEIVIPEIEISDEELIPYSAGEIFNQAESIMPQIKSAEFQLKSSETGFIIAKGLRSPTLSFNTYWGTRYSDLITRFLLDGSGNPIIGGDGFPLTESTPFLDQLSDNIGYGIGLNLSIPIFNRWQTNYMISNAKLGLDNSRLVLENEKNLLYKDIQQSYADARAALKRYRASQKTVISTEESFRYTEQRFNVGLVTSVEYNTSKNLLTQAQSDRLQAKYDYIFQKNKLEFYLGNPIKI